MLNSHEIDKGTGIQRNALFNVDEIKVRWKKAALENCTGIPCVVTPPAPSFTCGTSTVSDYDGNVYETVAIVGTGVTQCWTKSNLKVTKYNDGTLIPDLTNSSSNPWAPTSGARTGYDVSVVPLSDYVRTFGYLYNWYAVTDSRKLCPEGWYVPTDADWTIMLITLDPSQAVNSGNVLSFTGAQSITAGTVMNGLAPELIQVVFPVSQVVFALAAVFSAILVTKITSIVLPSTTSTSPGTASCTAALGVYRNYESKSFGASVRCLRD